MGHHYLHRDNLRVLRVGILIYCVYAVEDAHGRSLVFLTFVIFFMMRRQCRNYRKSIRKVLGILSDSVSQSSKNDFSLPNLTNGSPGSRQKRRLRETLLKPDRDFSADSQAYVISGKYNLAQGPNGDFLNTPVCVCSLPPAPMYVHRYIGIKASTGVLSFT
jgi:hypothetical protein